MTVAAGDPDQFARRAASDSDGSIVRVEYYVNGDKVGQATSPPYTVDIAPILVGSYSVVAIAVDNVGGMTASVPVTFTVSATLTTSVLQRGLNGYAGASDTYLDNYPPTTVRGGSPRCIWIRSITTRSSALRSSSRKAARYPMAR